MNSGLEHTHSDWMRAGWLTVRNSSLGRGKISLLSTSFRPILGPTHPVQWVPVALSTGVKWRGGKLTIHLQPEPWIHIYIHSRMRLHGIVHSHNFTFYLYSKPSIIWLQLIRMSDNPDRNMKKKFCSQLSAYFKRHVGFRSKRTFTLC
jgi:hypothetical protein